MTNQDAHALGAWIQGFPDHPQFSVWPGEAVGDLRGFARALERISWTPAPQAALRGGERPVTGRAWKCGASAPPRPTESESVS